MTIPPGYWPCACVKRDKAGTMSHIKLNPPRCRVCRTCKCKKPPASAMKLLDKASAAHAEPAGEKR